MHSLFWKVMSSSFSSNVWPSTKFYSKFSWTLLKGFVNNSDFEYLPLSILSSNIIIQLLLNKLMRHETHLISICTRFKFNSSGLELFSNAAHNCNDRTIVFKWNHHVMAHRMGIRTSPRTFYLDTQIEHGSEKWELITQKSLMLVLKIQCIMFPWAAIMRMYIVLHFMIIMML